jgi:hypothetical protein
MRNGNPFRVTWRMLPSAFITGRRRALKYSIYSDWLKIPLSLNVNKFPYSRTDTIIAGDATI